MTDEATAKDRSFAELSQVVNRMIEAHGKDFTMGTLVLAARFIAEGKSLTQRPTGETLQ